MSGFRLPMGGRIDRSRPITFRFDGRTYYGFKGDTLASALIASGERILGRSFKLHRPRVVFGYGPEEPNALVEHGPAAHREPNRRASMLELVEGLEAQPQNCWPSRRFDLLHINNLIARFLPSGFYYKTFMWPAAFWEKLYEPLIRRAAGLGRIAASEDVPRAEIVHHHCDLLVIGSGAAGLMAASMAAKAGARVMLVEQDFEPGGGLLLDPACEAWRAARLGDIASNEDAAILTRTSVIGAYDHNTFAAIERRGEHPDAPASRAAFRQHFIRSRRVILAAGASERLIAFPGNDRPGVMLAGAVLAYLERHAVACGKRAVLFANNDEAYQTAFRLAEAGVEIAGIVDPRARSQAMEAARASGLAVFAGHEVSGTKGIASLSSVMIRPRGGGESRWIAADLLAISGGHTPNIQLLTQARHGLVWDEAIAAHVPADHGGDFDAAGAVRGVFGIAEAAADGRRAASAALAALGLTAMGDVPPPPVAAEKRTPLFALWEVTGKGKAFVDLQHDVTAEDIRLAHREGYSDIEHAKRYTTHGMATDQGRTGGLVGNAILAEARGMSPGELGAPSHRPYTVPPAFAALAGPDVGAQFKPERLLPLHDWHRRAGAVFVPVGLWQRPLVYSPAGDTSWAPVLEEARQVRRSVGICDVSSLGKIDIQGADAAQFLDRIYATPIHSLPIGKARYGLMLREDGILFDDGTITRLGETHYLLSTTTAKSDEVLAHLEWHHQVVWPEMEVAITNVTDHWAQIALAGPNARKVLARVAADFDVSNTAFPFMAAAEATIAGIAGRLFRISFSGELGYEIAIPADHAEAVWEALLAAGAEFSIRPYGLDALNVMRVEKGHVTGSEITGTTTPGDLGLGRMLKRKGDFIGRILGERPGLHAPDRRQLVGLHPLDPTARLRGGANLVPLSGKGPSLGFVTAAVMASEGSGFIGLGLLENGQARRGETMLAASPVFGEAIKVAITSPHHLDPENTRIHV